MDLRDLPAVLPLHFFDVEKVIKKGEKLSISSDNANFLDEEPFSEVSIVFLDGGIKLSVKVSKPFEKAFFPVIEKGDGFEFFIDTRGIRDALINHKYCHHFVFLPKEVDEIIGVEVTRFRTNDKRELARKEILKVTTEFSKNGYAMEIFIPDIALYGFDIVEYTTLKCAYIVHRGSGEPNHFPKSAKDYNLKDHPLLWATIKLN